MPGHLFGRFATWQGLGSGLNCLCSAGVFADSNPRIRIRMHARAPSCQHERSGWVSLGPHCFLQLSSAGLIMVLVPGCCWAYSAFSV